MMDVVGFARLVSQVSALRGSALDRQDINNLKDTVEGFAANSSRESLNKLLHAMQRGQKIEAIKEYRTITNMGLKESKDAVEEFWTHQGHADAA